MKVSFIILLYCLFVSNCFSQNAFLNNGLTTTVPKYIDLRAGKVDAGHSIPYASVAEANTSIPSTQRCIGLTVNVIVNGVQKEYWYLDGVTDANLVEKTWDATTIANAKLRQIKFETNQMGFDGPPDPNRNLNKLWIGNFTYHPSLNMYGVSNNSHQDNALVNITDYASHGFENSQMLAMSTGNLPSNRRNGWLFMNYSDDLGYIVPTMETYGTAGYWGLGYEHRAYAEDGNSSAAVIGFSPINMVSNAPGRKFSTRPLFGVYNGRAENSFLVLADGSISTKVPSAPGATSSSSSKIKFGKVITVPSVTVTVDKFLEVEVDGQIIKLAIVQ